MEFAVRIIFCTQHTCCASHTRKMLHSDYLAFLFSFIIGREGHLLCLVTYEINTEKRLVIYWFIHYHLRHRDRVV